MIKRFLLVSKVLFIVLISKTSFSQVANLNKSLHYQGAVRSQIGTPLGNKNITVRASILDGSASGTVVYWEIRDIRTNALGLYEFNIGDGKSKVKSGTFDNVNWANNSNKFIKIEVDPNAGTNFSVAGTQPLSSVPYALVANNIIGKGVTIDNIAPGGSNQVLTTTPDGKSVFWQNVGGFITLNGDVTGPINATVIKDGAVTGSKLAPGAISADKLAPGAITGDKIANGAITGDKIAPKAVDGSKIADGAITTDKVAAGAITTDKLADGAVTANKLGANSVDGSKIVDSSINTEDLANGAVTADKLGANSVDGTKIVDGSINTADLADGAVTADKLGANSVDGTKIVDGSINTADLANGAVTADKLGANSVDGTKIVDGSINTADLANGAVTADKIAADAVDGTKIVDGSINTADLANGAVTADKLGTNSVDGTKIVDGSINTADLANGAVTADKLGANSVDGTKIVDGSINTADLANDAVDGSKIAAMGATNGQVLKYNTTTGEWAPANDENTTYTGSTSIKLNATGNSFEREALTGDVTAALNNNTVTINANAITTDKIAAGAVTSAKMKATLADGTTNAPAGTVPVSDGAGGVVYQTPSANSISGKKDIINSADITAANGSGAVLSAANVSLTINSGAITTNKIAAGAVTSAKMKATLADGTTNAPAGTVPVSDGAGGVVYQTPSASSISGKKDIINSADITVANGSGAVLSTANVSLTIANDAINSAKISDNSIVNADIAPTAAIATSKLAPGTANQVLTTNAAGNATEWKSADAFVAEPWKKTGGTTSATDVNDNVYILGRVGIGLNNPVSKLSNNSDNTFDAKDVGVNNNSFSWSMNELGYTGLLYNGATDGAGLMVKIKDVTGNRAILDLSTGDKGTAGPSVFRVNGDGRVSIGSANPNASAILDINSTDKALLLPRVTQTSSVATVAEGMMIYDAAKKCFRGYANGAWVDLSPCITIPPTVSFTATAPVINGKSVINAGGVGYNAEVVDPTSTIVVEVDVTSLGDNGNWTVTGTDAASGLTYSGTGTFTTTGVQTITLVPGTNALAPLEYGVKTITLSNPAVFSNTKAIAPRIDILPMPAANTELIDVTFGTQTWMDRNLGARRVATESRDPLSFGSYYQWGRNEEMRAVIPGNTLASLGNVLNGFTPVKSTTVVPANTKFITGNLNSISGSPDNNPPYDWMTPATQNNRWETANQGPCPTGYHVPTQAEWQTAYAFGSWTNNVDLYNSTLKLPAAAHITYEAPPGALTAGQYNLTSNTAEYWSSTDASTNFVVTLKSTSTTASVGNNHFKLFGLPVRCIKD